MTTPFKPGDFVVAKVTRYCTEMHCDPLPHVTPETPVWIIGRFIRNPDYDTNNEETLIAPEFSDDELEAMDWDGSYSLSRVCDEWELVPENEWPDEVYAAIAKRALLGEDE